MRNIFLLPECNKWQAHSWRCNSLVWQNHAQVLPASGTLTSWILDCIHQLIATFSLIPRLASLSINTHNNILPKWSEQALAAKGKTSAFTASPLRRVPTQHTKVSVHNSNHKSVAGIFVPFPCALRFDYITQKSFSLPVMLSFHLNHSCLLMLNCMVYII